MYAVESKPITQDDYYTVLLRKFETIGFELSKETQTELDGILWALAGEMASK